MLDLIPDKMKLDIWQWMVEKFGMTGTIILLALIFVTIAIYYRTPKNASRSQGQKAGDNAKQLQINADQNQFADDNRLFQTNSGNTTIYNFYYSCNQQYKPPNLIFNPSQEYKGGSHGVGVSYKSLLNKTEVNTKEQMWSYITPPNVSTKFPLKAPTTTRYSTSESKLVRGLLAAARVAQNLKK